MAQRTALELLTRRPSRGASTKIRRPRAKSTLHLMMVGLNKSSISSIDNRRYVVKFSQPFPLIRESVLHSWIWPGASTRASEFARRSPAHPVRYIVPGALLSTPFACVVIYLQPNALFVHGVLAVAKRFVFAVSSSLPAGPGPLRAASPQFLPFG